MRSLDCLTDSVLISTYIKAVDKNLDPYFIQLLYDEIENRGLEISKDEELVEEQIFL